MMVRPRFPTPRRSLGCRMASYRVVWVGAVVVVAAVEAASAPQGSAGLVGPVAEPVVGLEVEPVALGPEARPG